MASRNYLLPTVDQCYALTDEQCRMIMDYRDPDGIRAQRNWEPEYQAELVRQYMTMRSFPQIETFMRSKLDWSYKTYANRYRDWLFPVDRLERELAIMDLYALVTGTSTKSRAPEPFSPAPSQMSLQTPQIPSEPAPPHQQIERQTSTQPSMYNVTPQPPQLSRSHTHDRMSISTYSSANTPSEYSIFDNDTGSPRFSISTADTSLSGSSGSQYGFQQGQQHVSPFFQQRLHPRPQTFQRKPARVPKHDPRTGIWNTGLRVIACGQDHSRCPWDRPFQACQVCGFSQWHAFMINARNIPLDTFVSGMNNMRDVAQIDLAGNRPLHFLMAAGVGMDYLQQVLSWPDHYGQNSFGQSPLHVLNPQDLGEHLINVLKWFPVNLLSERDIRCRTPLHELLQHPFERDMYRKILSVFPLAAHHLRSYDNSGKTISQIMQEASLRHRPTSAVDYIKIQAGITEVKMIQDELEGGREGNTRPYGFLHIARGARGMSYFGFYQCRICNSNAHSNSYLDQMHCACLTGGLDRNDPDENGMTPAHLLITHARCNDDPQQTPETPAQTLELFRLLIFNSTLQEALHVLDREGNSLVFNIASRGHHEILDYVLSLEESGRKCAMVNACGKDSKGKERSVLETVEEKVKEVESKINTTDYTKNKRARQILCDQYNRLKKCKHVLRRHGAELKPTVTQRWGITPA